MGVWNVDKKQSEKNVECSQQCIAHLVEGLKVKAYQININMSSFSASTPNAAANEIISSEANSNENDSQLPVDEDIDEEASDKDDFHDWQAEDGEEDETFVLSLFCSTKLPSIAELIEHDKTNFKFDLTVFVKDFCTDDFSYIKLVNFIRFLVQREQQLEERSISEIVDLVEEELTKGEFLVGETYLKPVFENDPLLFLFDEIFEFEE